MLIVEHTIETRVLPSQIWKIWEDVSNWKTWDCDLEFSSIEGPFQAGTKGRLKPKKGPLVQIVLTRVNPLHLFVSEASLPGTKIVVSHALTRSEHAALVTHRIEMQGPLSWFFAFFIGRTMKKNLAHQMLALVKQAEAVN